MKAWLLFLLGSIAYFLIRYNGRTDKIKELNMKFWWKDNAPEFILSFILNLAVMLIFMDADTNITEWLTSFLPSGIVVPIKLVVGFACGLGLGKGVYELFKEKLKRHGEEILKK
ncbi:MAG: hypothetical protein M0R17_06955 [Candidatus Omnitrophica bacterium]|jgi:hypothetical protein|nr:hypothetical protein [Candidatus Omnitrophota bacterium]